MPGFEKDQQLSERFTLIAPLGQGGMGEVWLARDDELAESVAVKILSPALASDQRMIDLLRDECRKTRSLVHPNIVRVFDFHRDGDASFISLEYFEADDIGRYAKRHYTQFIPVLLPVLDALDYAHGLGLVHRDIKSANIMVNAEGHSRLADFGIAGATVEGGHRFDIRLGGSRYSVSPQQLDGAAPAVSDDIYGLGALLYELVTGHPPFYPGIDDECIRSKIPAPMVAEYPIPKELDALVMSMLAKDPTARPAGVADVREVLVGLIDQLSDETAPPVIAEAPAAQKIQTITPIATSAGSASASAAQDPGGRSPHSSSVPVSIALAAFVLLLIIAAGVFFYLPERVKTPDIASRKPADTQQEPSAGQNASTGSSSGLSSVGLAPYELARLAKEREQAERIVDQVLSAQSRLESRGVDVWAADEYASALSLAQNGDEQFRIKEYAASMVTYQDALTQLETLVQRSGNVLQEALASGQTALDSGDSMRAKESYALALTVDPGNAQATRGLLRAETLDEVITLVRDARRYENDGALTDARDLYQLAKDLDAEYSAANEGLSRVRAGLASARFNRMMSNGFAALDRQDYAAARNSFEQAKALRPSSSAPDEGLAQVEVNTKLGDINRYRSQGENYEKQERWKEAADAYASALKQDPNLVFALQGKKRADQWARVHDEIDKYVTEPGRLSSENIYQAALGLLEELQAFPNKGPVLAQKTGQLQEIVRLARSPVKVVLQSDNETDVMINRFGKLGLFETREIVLNPGTYTAKGTRRGYRDVLQKFTVTAGQTMPPIVVRCEEEI